jgi:hypothetical protein
MPLAINQTFIPRKLRLCYDYTLCAMHGIHNLRKPTPSLDFLSSSILKFDRHCSLKDMDVGGDRPIEVHRTTEEPVAATELTERLRITVESLV